MRCWHTHIAPGKDYRVMQYTHSSGCSLAYLQSPLQRGGHVRVHLGYVNCVFILRFRCVAKNYGAHVQEE